MILCISNNNSLKVEMRFARFQEGFPAGLGKGDKEHGQERVISIVKCCG